MQPVGTFNHHLQHVHKLSWRGTTRNQHTKPVEPPHVFSVWGFHMLYVLVACCASGQAGRCPSQPGSFAFVKFPVLLVSYIA